MRDDKIGEQPPRDVKNWVDYLSQLGPSSSKSSLYDEQLPRALRKLGNIQPLNVKTDLEGDLKERALDLKEHGTRNLILLAGMAGDGKTTMERRLWLELTDNQEIKRWEGDSTPSLTLTRNDGTLFTFRFIKDLSAENYGADSKLTILDIPDRTCLIVACNHGRLLDTLRTDPSNKIQTKLADDLEEFFFKKEKQIELSTENGLKVITYDLSVYSPTNRFVNILRAMLGHEVWNKCSACIHYKECPILLNRNSLWDNDKHELKTPALRQRDCIRLIECSGIHLPTRDLLTVASNNILGTQSLRGRISKKQALSCTQVFKDFDLQRKNESQGPTSYLSANLLGENLPLRCREESLIYKEFLKLGIGTYAPRAYDKLLDSFTGIEVNQLPRVVQNNDLNFQRFLLKLKRQNAFFSLSDSACRDVSIDRWLFTAFSSGTNFFKLLKKLSEEKKGYPPSRELIVGMNRAFTGQFRNEEDVVYLTTAGGRSRTLQGELLAVSFPVRPGLGKACIRTYLEEGVVRLSFLLNNSEKASFDLHPSLYEFFHRLSQGSTFSSFTKDTCSTALQLKVSLIQSLSEEQDPDENFLTISLLTSNKETSETITFELE